MTKLPIRERIGNVPQFPVGVVAAVAEGSGTSNPEVEEQQSDDVLLLIGDQIVNPIEYLMRDWIMLMLRMKANVVADALSRNERLKMIMSSEELIRDFEKMEIEVKVTGAGNEKIFEIAIQPELLEKIRLCQEKVMNEGRELMTGEEINTKKNDKGIMSAMVTDHEIKSRFEEETGKKEIKKLDEGSNLQKCEVYVTPVTCTQKGDTKYKRYLNIEMTVEINNKGKSLLFYSHTSKHKASRHVTHGYHLVEGKSNHAMKDCLVSEMKQLDDNQLGLFAIDDGHMGHSVTHYLQLYLFNNILREAALCSIRIIKKVPDLEENFVSPAASLLTEKHHGVLLTGIQLCTDLCEASTEALECFRKKYTEGLVKVLKDVVDSPYAPEYDISGIADPFLHIRLLRLLRVLGHGDTDASDCMNDILAQDLKYFNDKGCEKGGTVLSYHQGFSISAARLGLPDTGFISYGEMLDQGSQITQAVSIPVIGDGYNGSQIAD
ncbi:hypothetical protein AgCh_033839 [Apium graveolens]